MGLKKIQPVMRKTKTPCDMFVFAKGTLSVLGVVFSRVIGTVSNLKIFQTVIRFNPILVMDDFVGEKKTPEMLFDNKPVLANVTGGVGSWMSGAMNEDIPTSIGSSAFPVTSTFSPVVLLPTVPTAWASFLLGLEGVSDFVTSRARDSDKGLSKLVLHRTRH